MIKQKFLALGNVSQVNDVFDIYMKKSSRTGNPEVWGYEENSVNCSLVFGSLITGGFRNISKHSRYSSQALSKKLLEGYSLVSFNASLDDLKDAKAALRGSASNLSPAAFEIYSFASKLLGSKPNKSLQADVSKVIASADVLPKAIPPTTIFPQLISTSSESNSAWSW